MEGLSPLLVQYAAEREEGIRANISKRRPTPPIFIHKNAYVKILFLLSPL